MRWNLLVAVAVFALSIIATLVVACSDATKCTPGTLELDIALLSTAPLADKITVTSTDMDVALDVSFPHTPNASTPGVEHTSVMVTFPNGYPKDKVVHLLVRAYGGVTVLGANTAVIHLGNSCDTASVAVMGGAAIADLGATD